MFLSIFQDSYHFIKNTFLSCFMTLVILFLIKWGLDAFFIAQFLNELAPYVNVNNQASINEFLYTTLQMPQETPIEITYYIISVLVFNVVYFAISLTVMMLFIHIVSNTQAFANSTLIQYTLLLLLRYTLLTLFMVLFTFFCSIFTAFLGIILGFILFSILLLLVFGLAPAILILDKISVSKAISKSASLNFKHYAIVLPLYLLYLISLLFITLFLFSFSLSSFSILFVYNIFTNFLTFFALVFLYRFYSLNKENNITETPYQSY